MPQASMHQRAAFFFTCLALGGLSIVPVYASNGTVLLLSLGVLGFCRLKGGLHFIRDSLLTVAGMFFIALTVWIFLSLTWTEDGLRELPAALTMTLLSILGLIFMASVKDLDSRQTKIAQTNSDYEKIKTPNSYHCLLVGYGFVPLRISHGRRPRPLFKRPHHTAY